MKSSWITALTIVGVLGTATAAMAINADTLKGIDGGTIGNAIEVLVPFVSGTENPARQSGQSSSTAPTEQGSKETAASESPRSASPSTGNVMPAPSVSGATVQAPESSDTAGANGSGGTGTSGPSETSDSSAEDSGEDSSPEPTDGSSDDD